MTENQNLVLKFQELDINQATIIEKHSKQLKSLEAKHDQQVMDFFSGLINHGHIMTFHMLLFFYIICPNYCVFYRPGSNFQNVLITSDIDFNTWNW